MVLPFVRSNVARRSPADVRSPDRSLAFFSRPLALAVYRRSTQASARIEESGPLLSLLLLLFPSTTSESENRQRRTGDSRSWCARSRWLRQRTERPIGVPLKDASYRVVNARAKIRGLCLTLRY